MIAGELEFVPVENIRLSPKLNYRQVFPKIDALMRSMSGRNKQLLPILINTRGELVIGRRRLEAAKRLGWKEIMCRIIDLPEPEKAQLEENDEREPPSFRERVAMAKAVEDVERLKAEQRQRAGRPASESDGGRSDDKAAETVGWSRATYRDAKKIDEHGTEKLKDALDAGKVSVSDAAKVAGESPRVQNQAVADVETGKATTAAEAADATRPPPSRKARQPRKPKNGRELFNWREFDHDFGRVVRQTCKLYSGYGLRDAQGAIKQDDALREMMNLLEQFLAAFKKRYTELSNERPPEF